MKNTFKIYSVFGLMMAFLFLATPSVTEVLKVTQSADQETEKNKDEEQTSVSQLNFNVVLPSHIFDFTASALLIPVVSIEFLAFAEPVIAITKPVYRLSYFEKLYEHHIAINAP